MKQVFIYSTPTCVYCKMAKEFFSKNKIPFEERDVAFDAKNRDEMIQRTGQLGVPVILVDEEVVIGFDQKRLEELLK